MTETNVEQGIRRAAEHALTMTPEQRAAGEALAAAAIDRLRRMFVGPPNNKGRQAMYVATTQERDEWDASMPWTSP